MACAVSSQELRSYSYGAAFGLPLNPGAQPLTSDLQVQEF